MKKLTIIALAVCCCGAAQAKIFALGVKGGLNVPSFSTSMSAKPGTNAGFHAGLFGQVNVPIIGLGVQPEVLYLWQKMPYTDESGAGATESASFLEVPLNITWGIDLKVVRPFLALTPYLRYSFTEVKTWVNNSAVDVNSFSYGLGLGAGVELLTKLQLMGRYSWGLNDLVSKGSYKVGGFTLSLGYIF